MEIEKNKFLMDNRFTGNDYETYDSKSIFQDQLDAVERTSKSKGFDYVDLSLLTDGLRSEREQGLQ